MNILNTKGLNTFKCKLIDISGLSELFGWHFRISIVSDGLFHFLLHLIAFYIHLNNEENDDAEEDRGGVAKH